MIELEKQKSHSISHSYIKFLEVHRLCYNCMRNVIIKQILSSSVPSGGLACTASFSIIMPVKLCSAAPPQPNIVHHKIVM